MSSAIPFCLLSGILESLTLECWKFFFPLNVLIKQSLETSNNTLFKLQSLFLNLSIVREINTIHFTGQKLSKKKTNCSGLSFDLNESVSHVQKRYPTFVTQVTDLVTDYPKLIKVLVTVGLNRLSSLHMPSWHVALFTVS